MPAQVFAPLALTTSQYSGAVTAIDEFPHSGTDRLQTLSPVASGGNVSVEIDFDLSGSLNFNGHLNAVLVHAGTASGGWSTSAQLKVGGSNVGTPVVRARTGSTNLARYSQFHWPLSVVSSVAANPDDVSVVFTSTNLHATSQNHHIHSVVLVQGTVTPQPAISGVDWADVHEAWVPALSDNYLAHNDPLRMVPGLKAGQHLYTQLAVADPTYKTDDPELDHAVVFNLGRLAFTFDVAEPGINGFWCAHFAKTPNPLPTGDSNSQGLMCGIEAAALGGAQANTVVMSYSGGSMGVASWLVMTGSVGGESDHLRSNAPSPADAWVITLTRVNPSGNDTVHKHDMDGDPMVDADEIIDAEPANGNPAGYLSFGLGSRSTADRNWLGRWAGTVFLNGSLSVTDALEAVNAFAQAAGLVDVVAGGATATIEVDAQGAGVANEDPPLGPDPVPPPGAADWVMLLRADELPVGQPPPIITTMEVPYHLELLDHLGAPSGYGWRSADRDGYRVGYGFLFNDADEPVIRYAFVGGYAAPGELWSTVVFDQGGTDWTRFLWDGSPWDPETQGHEANDAPIFELFGPQTRPDERPGIRMVETSTGEVYEFRNYAALPMAPGVEMNQLAHITTPFVDKGRRPDSEEFIVYDRIQLGTYIDGGNRLHGIYYDVIHPNYHQVSTLDTTPELESGGSTARIRVDAQADQSGTDPPIGPDPLPPSGGFFDLKARILEAVPGVPAFTSRHFDLLNSSAMWVCADEIQHRAAYAFLDRGDGLFVARLTLVGDFGGAALDTGTLVESGTSATLFLYDGTPWDPVTQGQEAGDLPTFSSGGAYSGTAELPVIRIYHRPTGFVLEVRDFAQLLGVDPLVTFNQKSHTLGANTVTAPVSGESDYFERITVMSYYNGDEAMLLVFDILDPAYRLTSTTDGSIITAAGSTANVVVDAFADNPVSSGVTSVIVVHAEAAGFANAYWAGATATIEVDAEAAGTAGETPSGGATAVIQVDAQASSAPGFAHGSTATIEIDAIASGGVDYTGPFVGRVTVIPDFVEIDAG